MSRFTGKRVVVTGASLGIGRATAERFVSEGARVLITGRRADLLEAAARDIDSQCGRPVLAFQMDVSRQADVERLMAHVLEQWGGVDVLINNAGIANMYPFLDMPLEVWNETIAVNLTGHFLVGQAVAREMVKARAGVIVNMSSTNGLAAELNYAHYNASKAGILLLTKTMALELAPYGIRVNCVAPGYILTPLAQSVQDDAGRAEYVRTKIPLGRTASPAEVASVFAFLASDDASFITGECITIDGGQLAQ
jgi:NAD(P)-dependent dehydrogenase (short-subunit alcohol dehydrogenase family)